MAADDPAADDPAADGWFEPDPRRMPLERLLIRAGQALAAQQRLAVSEHAIACHGLSATALSVLGALVEMAGPDMPGPSQRELAGRLGVAPATLTPVLDVLSETGSVLRERDRTDRRIVRISITVEGCSRLAATGERVGVTLREQLPGLPEQHRAAVRDYLLAVIDATTGRL